DRDDDRWLAEGHVPRVRRADLLHAPLIKVVRIVRTELRMNGKVRRDALGADDRTGQSADERASDRENGQEYGHPSQSNTSNPADQHGRAPPHGRGGKPLMKRAP